MKATKARERVTFSILPDLGERNFPRQNFHVEIKMEILLINQMRGHCIKREMLFRYSTAYQHTSVFIDM